MQPSEITSLARKNNIFGEREDLVIRKLLFNGCVAAFHSPDKSQAVNLIARGKNKLYFIHLQTFDSFEQSASPLTFELRQSLLTAALEANAVAVLGQFNMPAKKVKFFGMDGKAKKSFD